LSVEPAPESSCGPSEELDGEPHVAANAPSTRHREISNNREPTAPDFALLVLQTERHLHELTHLLDRAARDLRAVRFECAALHEAARKARDPYLNQGHLGSLSVQECHVAFRVAGGATNREIAASMNISENTVKNHLKIVFRKLGTRSRWQLTDALASVSQDQLDRATAHLSGRVVDGREPSGS